MSELLSPSLRLATLLQANLEALESQWRQKSQLLQSQARPSDPLLGQHVGAIFLWLAGELRGEGQSLTIDFTSAADAEEGLGLSLALERVVAEFHVLRGCVFELASNNLIDLTVESVDIVNRVIDSAIAGAVKSLADHQSHRRDESLALAVHDLRSPLAAFSLATSLLERLMHPVPESQERALLDIMRSSVEKQDKLFHRVMADEMTEVSEEPASTEKCLQKKGT